MRRRKKINKTGLGEIIGDTVRLQGVDTYQIFGDNFPGHLVKDVNQPKKKSRWWRRKKKGGK